MKVLQINATYGYGSTGLIMRDIGDTLTSEGHEAYFAYQSTSLNVQNGYTVGNWLDRKAHALMCRIFGRQGYYSHGATRGLLRYIEKIKPDVVHLHNLHSNYVHLNKLFGYLAEQDVPTVITLHDCWLFTGKCFHYIDVGCNRFMVGCGSCPKQKAPPASLFFDASASVLADRDKHLHSIPRLKIIGCSEWMCNEARRGILKDLDVSFIRNGVDVDIFRPYDKALVRRELGIEAQFVIIGMANKWLLPSNATFLEKIKSQLSDGDRIMLVGCTEKQIRDLKGEKQILPVGFIKGRESMAKHYAAADVFVNVTHADTLPTVNMESICCGTPVITYNSCGSPETVPEGCGYVVRENDVDGIAEKINALKKDGLPGACAIGLTKFNKNVCYKAYVKEYEKIVN